MNVRDRGRAVVRAQWPILAVAGIFVVALILVAAGVSSATWALGVACALIAGGAVVASLRR